MSQANQRTDLLDRALAGKPPEVRARVLDLVVKLGVSPEDEFWLIFIAIGTLQILIEDAPQEWDQSFQHFGQELEVWTETNLSTLDLLARKAETTETLALHSKELVNLLSELVKGLSALSSMWQNSALGSSSWQIKSETFKTALDSRLDGIVRTQEVLSRQLGTLESSPPQLSNGNGNLTIASLVLSAATFILVLVGSLGKGSDVWLLHQGQQQAAEKIEQLLFKANREECLQGIRPREGNQCQEWLNRK